MDTLSTPLVFIAMINQKLSFRSFGQYLSSRQIVSTDSRFSKSKDDPYLHSIRIKQMAIKGDIGMAINYFQRRLKDKSVQSTVIFNTMIDALGHAGRFRAAEDVFTDMKRRNCPTDRRTFVSMLNALSNNEELMHDGKVKVLEIASKYYSDAVDENCQSIYLFNALLKLISRLGTINDAIKAFPVDLSDPIPDKYTYSIMLYRLKEAFSPVRVWMPYYERMLRDDVEIDRELLKSLLSCLRSSLNSSEQFDPYSLLQDMIDRHEVEVYGRKTIPIYYLWMDILIKCKKYREALAIYHERIKPRLKDRNADDRICALSLRLYNMLEQPERVFKEFEWLRTAIYYRPCSSAINSILDACIQMNLPKRAQSYLDGYVISGKVSVDSLTVTSSLKLASNNEYFRHYFMSTLKIIYENSHPAAWQESIQRHPTILKNMLSDMN